MTDKEHGHYFIPAPSKWPIIASLGLFCLGLGAINLLHAHALGPTVFIIGSILIAYVMFGWFGEVIRENRRGLYGEQSDRSFRWGMVWFIFSEVMLFAVFFGALFYTRAITLPRLAGTNGSEMTHILLWPNFLAQWPLFKNPEPSLFPGPKGVLAPWGIPALNTFILLISAVMLTWGHWGLKNNNRKQLILGLILTIILGGTFLGLQVYEYWYAHHALDLTLHSGIYGSTFFMLTGFHAAHVTVGAIMLAVMLFRAYKGDFTSKDHFGFEAAAWYWHFVDVVWLILFVTVYWL